MKIYDLIRSVDGVEERIFSSPNYDEVERRLNIAEACETEFTYVSYTIGWHTED